MGHVSPKSGSIVDISNSIQMFLDENNLSDKLTALACDGTNVNGGASGGVNHYLKIKIGKTLQWFVCLLHMNELPLRHLIEEIDGKTLSGNKLSGPVGKAISDLSAFHPVKFRPISSSCLPMVPRKIEESFSTDQKYLYRICKAIDCGTLDADFAKLKIGPLNQSRWLTTANGICYLSSIVR